MQFPSFNFKFNKFNMSFYKFRILTGLAIMIVGLFVTACPSDSNDPVLPKAPVLSKAKLKVEPTEIDFGENDTQKAFNIENVGQQNLNWEISEDVDWVTDFQSRSGKISGGGENQITVKIDRTKLNDGANLREIQVTAKADDGGQLEGGPINVTVKATKLIPPQLSMATNDITEKTANAAKAEASIETLGSSKIAQHGHVWSTVREPDVGDGDDARSVLGERTSKGSFQTVLANLKPNTTYYIRAYTRNEQGRVNYSNEVTFKTSDPVAAVLSMANNDLFDLKLNSAIAQGNLDKLGSSPIIQHGHIWTKTNSPTLGSGDSRSRLGTLKEKGSFTSNVTGLESNTIYYIRAYASTEVDTVYSNTISFATGGVLGR